MAFKTIKQKEGLDTTKPLAGYIGAGTHRVTIREAKTEGDKISIRYGNGFGETLSERIFVTGKAGFSRKLQDLLSVLDLEAVKQFQETNDPSVLVGKTLRIIVGRSFGEYIERVGSKFVIRRPEKQDQEFDDYNSASAALDQDSRAFWKINKYLTNEIKSSGGVW